MKYEKTYKRSDVIAMNTDDGVVDITLHNLLNSLGFLDEKLKDNLCLDYTYDGDDIDITEISNQNTGKVYWKYNKNNWSPEDEVLADSLLMWGEIE